MNRGIVGKRANGSYYFKIRITDSFGNVKQIQKTNKDWKTKKEALAALEDFRLNYNSHPSEITLNHLYKLFIETKSLTLKKKTIYTLDNSYKNHIEPFFGEMIVENITRRDIIKWQKSLLSSNFKSAYLKKIQEYMRTILNFGIKHEYINRNPFMVDIVKNQNEKKEEMMFWTDEEFKRFIEQVSEPTYRSFFMVLYYCGLREGEAIALQVNDIDFNKNTIKIDKTYNSVHHETTSPKTSNSFRTVALFGTVKNELQSLVETYKKYSGFNEESLVFGFNKHLAPTSIKRHQIDACLKAGVKIIRIHDFRHSHVALLIHLDVRPMEIAKRLGHTPDMVNNVYGHLFPDYQVEIVRKMDEYFKNKYGDETDLKNKSLN